MPQILIGLFTSLAGIIGGALNGVLGTTVSMMKAGAKAAFKFHQEGISLGRDLGLSLNQANAYTKVLTERTQILAKRYGVTSEAIKDVQRSISDTTGKQLLLNEAQAESLVIADKLVGAQTKNQFMDTIMNSLGGQVDTVNGAISKAYATAMKQGLNAQKFSKKVAENLSMANRLNFKNGIDGITRMTAMAEKLGLNLKSVETAAGQFMELDSAIEHSAQLQMLGGSIGASFGNPLQNAYEANYDPEAFAKRMEDAIKGMATYDPSKGYATMSAVNQDILRNYAKAMGLNSEDVIGNAKKQAEVRYKETVYSDKINSVAGGNESLRNYLLNNSQINQDTRKLEINGRDIDTMSSKDLEELARLQNSSDSDILKEQALHLTSIDEAITGNKEAVGAAFAKGLGLDTNATNIIKSINGLGTTAERIAENLGVGAGKALTGMLNWMTEHKDTLKSIANGVIGVSKFLADNWKVLIAAIVGWKLLKPALGMKFGGRTLGGRLGAKALGGLKNIGQRMSRSGIVKPTMDTYRMYNAIHGGSKIKNFGAALKNSWKSAPKLTKATGIAGVALGAVQGATAFMGYSAKKKELKNKLDTGEIRKEEYNAQINEARVNKNEGVGSAVGGTIGAAIGTAFGGPVGGIIAGYIGDKLGGFIGKHWDGITKRVSNAWNTSINWVSDTTSSIVKGIGNKLSSWGESVSNWWGEVASPAISESMSKIKDKAKSFMSGIGDKFNNFWDEHGSKIRVFSKINPITGILTEVIEFFRGPSEYIKGAKNAFKNVIKTITSFPETIEQWLYDFTKDKKWLPTIGVNHREENVEKHADGGIVGGNSYSGDKILTGLNSGEMVLNKDQQAQLFKFISNASSVLSKLGSYNGVTYYNASNKYSNTSSVYDTSKILSTVFNSKSNVVSTALNANNEVKTMPFGENSFRKIPKEAITINNQVSTDVKVKDFNVNINGTIKLDGGNSSRNIDVKELLSDASFVSSLKDLITHSINTEMNGGRFLMDNSTLRGGLNTTTWGR